VFHDLNIEIKRPKKDTCALCDKFHMKIKLSEDNSLILQQEWQEHTEKAELAYEEKRKDKEMSQDNAGMVTITFDLQQCLPTPVVTSSIAFYKRQLWTYNLTVHNCKTQQVHCFMWHEGQAARGANEIASCMYKYLMELPHNVHHVTMYSDSCQGQNKNSHMAVMCMIAVQNNTNLLSIDHKFLIPGHTHMESDGDHSLIEKKKKKYGFPIHHPHDWAQLVRVTGKKTPFLVTEIQINDFLDFSSLLKQDLILRKNDMEGEKITWRNIQWLHFEKQTPGSFSFKTNLRRDEIFRMVNFRRRGRHMGKLLPNPSYHGPNPISVEKKRDLLDLLPFISETFWEFYRNLKTSVVVRNTLPDATDDEELEDEIP
jgi:hypothetical protein